MSAEQLIELYRLDSQGGVSVTSLPAEADESQPLWLSLDYSDPQAPAALEDLGLDEVICTALLAEDTRPRVVVIRQGVLMIMRGINLNPGAEPEDLVSIRLWLQPDRIVTSLRRHLFALEHVRETLQAGHGPVSVADFFLELATGMLTEMGELFERLDEQFDDFEDALLSGHLPSRTELGELRRTIITLRRYLLPQREALSRLVTERLAWLDEHQRHHLRELADRATRYVEDLEAMRERAVVIQEELNAKLSEKAARRVYLLSLVAAIFLPLTFVTGLMGMNVGGIPGAGSADAFLKVSLLMAAVAFVMLLLFRWWRWM